MRSFASLPGLRVGHAQNETALTGCTVILCDGPSGSGAIGGIDQRGGAPGTRETDALHPMHLIEKIHAIVLAGGSAFGLEAATGVVRYLEERGVGFDVRVAKVPIVPAAILFDLAVGAANVRPDAAMGYQACLNATSDPPAEGNVGAGMGATVGKLLGMEWAMKAGLGCSVVEVGGGLLVGAIVAVNALGDVIDPSTNRIIAGVRNPIQATDPTAPYFADSLAVLRERAGALINNNLSTSNTVIGVVATNAALTKEQTNKVAQMAQDGLARTVRPAHTMFDGDTIFALSTGPIQAEVNTVGAFAAEAFAQAILRAVRSARPVAGLPSANEAPT